MALRPHLEREPAEFFKVVLHENLSTVNFIHSDFVVWNHALASHYQRGSPQFRLHNAPPGADKETFYRRQVKDNPHMMRGGLMTMSSIMLLTTDGENTSPILRGVWVARRMLGMEIEAPASVPALEVNLENVSKPREVLAKHKADPSCFACHAKFDHFGLALENYNVLGEWKTDYVHPVQNEKGQFELVKRDPIDALAETPDGEPMPGVEGVKQHLLANKDQVMANLLEKLFSYALGREARYKDREALEAMLREMEANDHKLRDAIVELVASESFIER